MRHLSGDDSLQAAFDRGLVKRSAIVDAGGLRVGLFSVIGADAAEVAPFASPVSFRPAAEVAKLSTSCLPVNVSGLVSSSPPAYGADAEANPSSRSE